MCIRDSLRSIGIEVNNFYFDTMLASYVLDPDQKHGMNDLSEKYLNYSPIPISTLIGDKKDPTKIFDVDANQLSNYAAEDADITYKLYETLEKELKKQGIDKVAYDIEFPLVPVLQEMENEGVRIDIPALNQFSKDLQILIDNYTSEIFKSAGTEFNINSPKQLQEILFTKLNLATGRKTKTGFSTDARSLENLRGEHEIVDLILSYRQASKLKSTYADALPNLINKKTGRIHTNYNQTIASTGRLSSIDPNLQNIPIRTDMGKEIRKAFIPVSYTHLRAHETVLDLVCRLLLEKKKKTKKQKKENKKNNSNTVVRLEPNDRSPREPIPTVRISILHSHRLTCIYLDPTTAK